MGYNKNKNLLGIKNPEEFPKFSTKKWIEIFDFSNGVNSSNKDIRFKTTQLRNDLCDFNDAYIVETGKITAMNPNPPAGVDYSKKLVLKNSPAPFFNCILKINGNLIEDTQDLDIIIPMYDIFYYSKNFRKTAGSFWNYYLDMPNSTLSPGTSRTSVHYPISSSESFDYKTKLVGKLPDGENELEDIKIVVPLQNLSRFMFSLDFLMINMKIELILKWSQGCVLTERAERAHKTAEASPPQLAEVPAVNTPI